MKVLWYDWDTMTGSVFTSPCLGIKILVLIFSDKTLSLQGLGKRPTS